MIASEARVLVAGLVFACAVVACVRIPNPNHDGASGTGSETGDGDGDGDDNPSTGDGDGDPSTGDGDTDPTLGDGDGDMSSGDGDSTAGDGDGDAPCEVGVEGCPCTPLETCNEDLACVLGLCVDASSCAPVDDSVQISVQRNYAGMPPVLPMVPTTFVCSFSVSDGGNKALLQASNCNNNAALVSLNMELAPKLPPIEELFDQPLAATVTLVEADSGFYMRINVGGLDLYYVDGPTLFYEGVTMYPWALETFSSACGTTPSMCGETERLALFVDGGVVFDGNAGEASSAATAWVETNLDVCGVPEFEAAFIAH